MPKQQMRLRKPKSNALRRDDGAGGFLSPALALGKGQEPTSFRSLEPPVKDVETCPKFRKELAAIRGRSAMISR
jgi:hypothetical protein